MNSSLVLSVQSAAYATLKYLAHIVLTLIALCVLLYVQLLVLALLLLLVLWFNAVIFFLVKMCLPFVKFLSAWCVFLGF